MIFNCRHIYSILITTILLLFGRVSSAQSYSFEHLSIERGLPQSQAFAIMFDSNQYAWIGTQGGGITRYDGVNFLTIKSGDSLSLISNRIYSIAQIEDEIWVGQRGGITVLSLSGHFSRNYYFQNRSNKVVLDIIHYEEKLFFATDSGLFKLDNDQIIQHRDNPNLNDTHIENFFLSTKNELWLCSNKGLLDFKDPFKSISSADGVRPERTTSVAIYPDEEKEKWFIGTYGGGVYLYDRDLKEISRIEELNELNGMIIRSLKFSNLDELWIGTMNNGVYIYSLETKKLKNFKSQNGLSNNHIRTIETDLWGNVWLGTSGGGISIFQNSPFIEYNTFNGLNGNYVYSVLNDTKGSLWLGTEGKGILRINDTSNVLFDEEFGFYSEKVKCIFQDNKGDIWFGSEGKGLGIFSQYDAKDTIYSFNNESGLNASYIKCFVQDEISNTIYIGTYGGGIYKVNKDWSFPVKVNFEKVQVSNGDIPQYISSLRIIKNRLWYTSSENGYGFISDNKIYQEGEGKTYRNVVGQGDVIWLGSSDNGILRLTMGGSDIIQRDWISVNDKLVSNNIYQLTLNENELWVGSEQGLDRIFLDSLLGVERIEHFGLEEGLKGKETNVNASYLDNNGTIWFGTVAGLYAFIGGQTNPDQNSAPVLSFEDFKIFYESIDSTEYASFYENGKMVKNLILPYDQNNIGFSFKAIHYTFSNKIKYRWKLIGSEDDWSPPSKLTTAFYSNLPPGEYTFQVQASIEYEKWDLAPLEINFTIDTPIWEKWWFRLSYYGLIGIVVVIISLIIIFRYRRKHRIVKEKFEMEKNLLELEQKALRLQMNPHFIFNALNSIHNLIILNDPDKARYALAKFSKLMRTVLENSREKFISLDDEIETLENYVQLEKLTSNLEVELTINIDDEIDSSEEILPPLMIQPFVENAIIHGLKELDRPGLITISFKLINEHLLECSIEDNGRGRIEAFSIKAQKENYHKSTALKVTQERLSNLNTSSEFVPFEIIDVKDKDDNPAGTKVIFRLEI